MISKTLKHYASIMSEWLNGFTSTKNQTSWKKHIIFVDTKRKLSQIVNLLEGEKEIAVDTEGNSLYSYHSKICLIQVSTRKNHYIIDPIQIKEISCLKNILSNPHIEKILHGSAYDIQMLYLYPGIQIKNLFDTQIAASFLGEARTGLAILIKKYFGITLNKVHQKSNWAIRPLPDEMLEYAIADTAYLLPLADKLKEQLITAQRIDWVREECEYLAGRGKETNKKDSLLFKKKHFSDLKLNTFESIMQFRENLARKMDLPPFRVIDKKAILNIVESENLNMKELKKLTSRFPIIQNHLDEMLEAIKNSDKHTLRIRKKSQQQIFKKCPEKKFKGNMDRLYIWRTRKAEQLKIEPHLILSQRQIPALAESKIRTLNDILNIRCLKTWQKQAFAEELFTILKKE